MDKAAFLVQQIITLEVSLGLLKFTYLLLPIVIKHQGKGKRIDDVIMQKPNEDDLYHFKEAYGELENFCPDHPLNTENYKRKLLNQDDVTAFCFYSDETTFMFSGYGDGLICCWDVNTMNPSENAPASIPLLGHTNKINHLEASEELGKLFSCSNDCTLRQWSLENLGICERIFKFQDPVNVCKMHVDKGILFAGCWDN